ncbi:LysE family translocator [Francisella orientalis]|uniref:LysE family translocator n=1 Tax=Francisella orientalis TaxID=299583 RepID=UPI000A648CE3|nr:LysE family translocator [Francisella orientalis]
MSFYVPLFLFCISSTITPGPNNMMLLISSIRFGVRKTLSHYLGVCLGFPFMVLIIGLGLESIFINHPTLHTVIKVVGGVYMLWLAFKIILSSNFDDEKAVSRYFTQAALFQWINPKAWIMAIGVVSTYTVVSTDMSLLPQVLIIQLFI